MQKIKSFPANLNKTKQDFTQTFSDTHTLAFMHFHRLNEGPLCEFLKIYQSGKPCVMLIRNDENLIEDNGKILQEKEFEILGQKFKFKYCVYYTQTLRDLNLPFYAAYGKNEKASMMAWYNTDYLFYVLRSFLPEFKHYFLIDYDVFLNGSYKEYFKLYENDETDVFLAYFRKEDELNPWYWLQETAWIYDEKARKNWYGCFFSCERISARALDKLYPQRIKHGKIFAKVNHNINRSKWLLCEAFVATEAVNMGFSVKSLLNNKMIFDDDIDLTERRLFVLPDNHFYHFVKGQFHKRIADKNAEISKLNNEIQELN